MSDYFYSFQFVVLAYFYDLEILKALSNEENQ